MTSTSETTITAHEAAKRFTGSDLRHARKAYGRVLADHASEQDVTQALVTATMQAGSYRQSRQFRTVYYDALTGSAPVEVRTLAAQAFMDSLAESDARRQAASERYVEDFIPADD